ncbi:multidrug effflux MFS transporter [Dactylosporangium roseum]|uniref:Multidrug effflux MFS transporter n=1 Tax=Dactylosporangium roseum TaxID=47989 RepID=A0ABY5YZ62_9ACTN|nr:multidrug effflux MFS transporter [Dactylosporangium roseum]UWZ34817.1 multidrug effflux MFS transporter [Dactylosporangium roseum]
MISGAKPAADTTAAAGHRSVPARPAGDRSGAGLGRLALFGALSALGPVSIDMYAPALPKMAAALGGAPRDLQLTMTVFVAGLAIGQLVIGPVSDAVGRRRPLLWGLALYTCASLACAAATGTWWLTAGRLAQALGAAGALVLVRAVVRDLYTGTHLSRTFARLMLVNGLAPVLAPAIGGFAVGWVGWRWLFVAMAASGAAMYLAVLLKLPDSRPPGPDRAVDARRLLRSMGRVLGDRAFVVNTAGAGLTFAGCLFAYVAGGPFVLQVVYGLSPQAFAAVMGVNGVGIILAGRLSNLLVGRWGEYAMVVLGMSVACVGGAGVLVTTTVHLGLPVLLCALFVLVGPIGLVVPNSASLALAAHAETAGAASALLGVTHLVIGAIAIPLVGIGGGTDPVVLGTVMVVFTASALALTVALRPRKAG